MLSLQAVAAAFFLLDALADVLGYDADGGLTDKFEYLIAVTLAASLIFTIQQIRSMYQRQKVLENQIKVASGAFQIVMEKYFDEWDLSASERDVSLLAIKGLSISEIAVARQTKAGTIKAQLNSIYKKANVTGRMQLLSLFVEELFTEKLVT